MQSDLFLDYSYSSFENTGQYVQQDFHTSMIRYVC